MITELKVGDSAPDFKATVVGGIYGGGQEVKLADLAGSTLVLYFYPKDDTPGLHRPGLRLARFLA